MKIGELAKLTGLSASRIRFYESSGLIQAALRTANGYRDYPPETVWILQIITHAQSTGFSLDEIRHLVPVAPNIWEYDELLDSLKRKLAEVEALQKRLAHNQIQLRVTIDSIEREMDGLPCADRPEWLFNRLREQGLLSTLNPVIAHPEGTL